MIRADLLLFGYRVFTVQKEDVTKVATILLKGGISVRFRGPSFIAGEKKSKKIEALLGTRVKFYKSELMGFSGFLLKNRKSWGIMSALVSCIVIFLFGYNRVWDVRVDGCSKENEERVIDELEKCGFSTGASWSGNTLSEVEVDFLKSSEIASWVNINRRGTVAYVTVIEKVSHPASEEKRGYSNVVAEFDAVIEEITVTKGVAAVKVGDSVKKGDLLISGIVTNEFETEFCYAEGTVVGRVSDAFSYTISDTETKTEEKERRLCSVSLKIFNFSLNIFNRTRNCGDGCDIIDTVDKISLFGKRLPFAVHKRYAVDYESVLRKLDAQEMTLKAADGMTKLLDEKLGDATLIRIRTEGNFSANSYTLKSSVVYLSIIGADREFSVEQR